MRFSVNPTRIELLRLKKRLILAQRGYRLLKEKEEELMRIFLALIEEIKNLRKQVEEEVIKAQRVYLSLSSIFSEEFIEGALKNLPISLNYKSEEKNIFNLTFPQLNVDIEKKVHPFFADIRTPLLMDELVKRYIEVFPKLLEIANKELILEALAKEIESVRRRVNALEYILIPEITTSIGFIESKLEEIARSHIVRIMKIKEIIRAH